MCNVSSCHLSLKSLNIFTKCRRAALFWFIKQCVRSWVFGTQGCDSWPHWLSVRVKPPRHHRCVFYLKSSVNPLYLQLHGWKLKNLLSTSKPILSHSSAVWIKNMASKLFLNAWLMFGDVPFSLQLFLLFSVGAAPSAGMEMDIIVEKTCTVKEVRKKCNLLILWNIYLCVCALFQKSSFFIICSV